MTNEVAEYDSHQRAYKPARSPEQREMQMMALAMELSEKRLQEGTASASEIVYWLNQASPKARLERKQLELQSELLQARIDLIRSDQQSELDFKQAYKAFQGYSGKPEDVVDGEFYEK
nr:MAG TPA: hypothetical protein [Caudoviricetes sp.]